MTVMALPRVSVIIPAYNAEHFVQEAIESVLAQTHSNVECIVVNDGSTDETLSVLNRYKDHIVIIDQENQGVSCARNRGIKEATGEWISFLDADDIWHPNKLLTQLHELEQIGEGCLIHSTNMMLERSHLSTSNYFELMSIPYNFRNITHQEPALLLLEYHFAWLQNTIVHSSLIKQNQLWFNTERSLYEDFEWLLQLSLLSKWKLSDDVLVEIKRRDNAQECLSSERSRNEIGAALNMLEILKSFKRAVLTKPALVNGVNKKLSKQFNYIGNIYEQAGNHQNSRNYYWQGLRSYPSLKMIAKTILAQIKLLLASHK